MDFNLKILRKIFHYQGLLGGDIQGLEAFVYFQKKVRLLTFLIFIEVKFLKYFNFFYINSKKILNKIP
jgi:hypothetical protein